MVDLVNDPFPDLAALDGLWRSAWGGSVAAGYGRVLERSLVHVGAYEAGVLVGFVNVAWDGGVHAFVLDTCVHAEHQRRGIATALMHRAAELARARGAEWLHVDFEPQLEGFYRGCGFAPSAAGVMRLV
ncbi:GNAT family N-acetyltransferase [Devosia neptuniae]|uniref:GNAT family N-acetyltransferase n=1 Tax=Devosia neptuniae TaxID=191302 RepID=A0ABY6CBF3_9HYPH|nr:GNAT family N-acetyltransferase [Devosia neptuniae]UXN68586.1 GNAT family N-acetyltransferase [Devosia neptuniae]